MFKALLVDQVEGATQAEIQELDESRLPEGDVLVAVSYSSLNYKDGLAVTGKGPIIAQFPAIPGIDLAGKVLESEDPRYAPGQSVVLTGWGVGERHWGGMAEKARVNGDWLVPLPEGMSERDAMAIGTAGFTAMLCVLALEDGGVRPDSGPVLVTGASGGVGSVAVALLGKLGYEVTAATGRTAESDYLRDLGASEIRSPGGDERETPSSGEAALGRRGGYGGRRCTGASPGGNLLQRHGGRLRPGRQS